MIRKEENGVVVEYDYPNIIDGIKIASKIRKGFGEDVDSDSLLAETITHMHSLITLMSIDGEPCEYEALLRHKPARKVLIMVADDLIGDIFLDEQKKSQ